MVVDAADRKSEYSIKRDCFDLEPFYKEVSLAAIIDTRGQMISI